jgi:hypothetical protein
LLQELLRDRRQLSVQAAPIMTLGKVRIMSFPFDDQSRLGQLPYNFFGTRGMRVT